MQKDKIFNLKKGFYIVTGGLGLLGKKHCEAISEYGGTPVIFDIDPTNFESFKKEFQENSKIEPIFMQTEITDDISIKESMKLLLKEDIYIRGFIYNGFLFILSLTGLPFIEEVAEDSCLWLSFVD